MNSPNLRSLIKQISGYSGIMQIKFPTYSPLRFFCGLARPCNISDIRGEGLSNDDRVMLLTKCGDGTAEDWHFSRIWLKLDVDTSFQAIPMWSNCHGFQEITFLEGAFSIRTYHEGTRFLLPASTQAVSYQALSNRGTVEDTGGAWQNDGDGECIIVSSQKVLNNNIHCFGLWWAKLFCDACNL